MVLEQRNLHKLFDEVLEIFGNEKLKENMEKNLERVDDLNDASKIVSDLSEIARSE